MYLETPRARGFRPLGGLWQTGVRDRDSIHETREPRNGRDEEGASRWGKPGNEGGETRIREWGTAAGKDVLRGRTSVVLTSL